MNLISKRLVTTFEDFSIFVYSQLLLDESEVGLGLKKTV